jgi:thymidylate kinase
MGKPLFITFCGMDGVGKTTQAILLEKKLRRSHKVKRVWIRSPHTFAYFIWRFFNMFGYAVPSINSAADRLIWSIIEIVSLIPKILTNVYLPRFLGFTLIGERYLIDSIATISCYFLRDPGFIHSWMSNFLLKFVPADTIVILLDADVVIIGKRRLSRNSQNDKPVEIYPELWLCQNKSVSETLGRDASKYITPSQQREVYLNLAKKVGAYIIDTSDISIEEIHRMIFKKITDEVEL